MPVPKPPTSLDNSCMVIHDKTLYSYSPEAFLSIPLENEAEWKTLEMGVKVTGSTCVGSTPADASQAGFYVVGGNGGPDDFSGLQKYTYSTGKWTNIKLADRVTKNRQGHAATYIKANNAIVMYAGNQDGSHGPSSQTFTIQVSEPFDVHGYQSSAPPAVSPRMLSWSDADAAMITGGGDAQGNKVWLFNPAARWRDSGASLKMSLEDTSSKRLALVTADDGSKVIYAFNIKESPMTVDRIRVQDSKGDPVHDSTPVARRSPDEADAQSKRRLAWDSWPKYNSTFAPESMGPGVVMASSQDGLIAFASKDKLEFFDAKDNTWLNATAMLGAKEAQVLLFSSATTTASSATMTSSTSSTASMTHTTSDTVAATSSTAAAVAAGQNKPASGPSSNAILGITLGCILGLMALLGLLLLLLRRRKRHRRSPQVDGANDEKDTTAFVPTAMPARSAATPFRGHHPKASRESWSSMAILMGRVGKDRPGLSRRLSNGTSRSSVSSLHKMFKSTISKPIPQSATNPVLVGQDEKNVAFAPDVGDAPPRSRNLPAETNDSTRRSSGWNRYWSGGSALQMLGLGPAKRNTTVSDQSSQYSEGGNPAKVRGDSATVPPLNLDGRPEVSNVVSGSPMVSQFANGVPPEGMSGKIVHPASRSSGYSSGIPESINEAWDPTEAGNWGANRTPAASAYAPSYYFGEPSASSPAAARAMPPSGVSQQPQLAMAATSSDMSWLNLGDQSRR